MSLAVLVLAAGEGTRMKSSHPKVLHQILGQPIISYVIGEAMKLDPDRVVVVVGSGAERVKEAIGDGVDFVLQKERLGTGHAARAGAAALKGFKGDLLILSGDSPLIRAETLKKLIAERIEKGAAAAVLTAELDDPVGYGRIVRSGDEIAMIVEERDAGPETKAISEVNGGIYAFEAESAMELLKDISNDNDQKEYYLTDLIGLFSEKGRRVVAMKAADASEVLGINSRQELAKADRIMRMRINARLMDEGVTMIQPDLTFIGPSVKVGRDSVIYPMTFLEGTTEIGEGCRIGPSVRMIDSKAGRGVKVENAVIKESVIEDGADLGPFCSLRAGTSLGKESKIGTFVEVKKALVGKKSKIPHLSYIGDAIIGDNVNIGAGSITCNYDGFEKHKTVIEDDVFIGSDSMLVAPVKIEKGAMTGAGSTISKDVPSGALAIERSEQRIIEGYVKNRREGKKED
ncbi:MAG: bifunctional UDP-N-acetylglucosamine diphosphorylase/glucosamine-1-phosphate N-acetyltransferase GlmU [Actinomycetota bacterium]|nr:bifunctional UDP-N-acetylglucosamine diphosphorylase/glucosamine-1-phosphate N-acetyltransferase GlmU [Actinomycetota bacterium]